MPISEALKTALAQGTGHFVTLIRVTSRASDVVAYALHTRDVTFDGDTFEAAPFEPSRMQQQAGTQADNATVTHLLNDVFTKANIRGRKWAGATVEIGCVDTLQLAEGWVRRHIGRIGDVTTTGQEAQTEFRGLMQVLHQELGDRTSKRCRYQLGDPDCTLSLAAFTDSGTVVTVTNQQRFVSNINSHANDYFKYGRIIWTGGLNDGLEMEVITNFANVMVLYLPMPSLVQAGDTFDIVAGDDKSLATCHGKFANAVNFGGEGPSIPTRESLFTFPN